MSGVTLTPQQRSVVENRGGSLLVSAAAGSGKTKVLVDRLLLYLSEGKGKTNIDDFLIFGTIYSVTPLGFVHLVHSPVGRPAGRGSRRE